MLPKEQTRSVSVARRTRVPTTRLGLGFALLQGCASRSESVSDLGATSFFTKASGSVPFIRFDSDEAEEGLRLRQRERLEAS